MPFSSEPPRALEMLAAQRVQELWDSSLTFLERGKAEDDAGAHAAAAILYSEGIEGLQALGEVSKREDVLASYEAIVMQYSARLEELRRLLLAQRQQQDAARATQQQSGPAASAASTTSAAAGAGTAAPVSTSPLAQARLCAELAMHADESGVHDSETAQLYTQAAEQYLKALRLESEEGPKAQHRKLLTQLLERAEQLKGLPTPQPAAAQPRPPPAASGRKAAAASASSPAQSLSDDEKEVLARSSTISGKLFYPYLGDGQRERFHYDEQWEDPDGLLALSAKQRQHLGRWARPSSFVRGEPKMIYLVSSLSITQTM
jgi:hypothetical protein